MPEVFFPPHRQPATCPHSDIRLVCCSVLLVCWCSGVLLVCCWCAAGVLLLACCCWRAVAVSRWRWRWRPSAGAGAAQSPWRSGVSHSRGGRNDWGIAGDGHWPAEMARRHLSPPADLFQELFERAFQGSFEDRLEGGAATYPRVFCPRRQSRWAPGTQAKAAAGWSLPPHPG